MEPSYVGAYWGSRRESAMECGRLFARCIAALADLDPALAAWYRRGARKAAANTPVAVDAQALTDLLVLGLNRRDVGGEVIEELGFSLGLWNRAQPAVGLSATVGAHPTFAGVLNHVVLELPPQDDASSRLYRPGTAAAILEVLVETWQPEWATWATPTLRDGQGAAPREPVVGWLTYLRGGLVDKLPVGESRTLGTGTVIQAAPDIGDVDLGAILKLRHHLLHAGALQPIP